MSLASVSLVAASRSLLADAVFTAIPKGGVTVDVDLSFVWSSLLFILLLAVLTPVLFRPMLRLFEERERRIEGAKLAARKMDEASATALGKYETEMRRARHEGNEEREKLRAEGLDTENQLMSKVRTATATAIADGRKQIADDAAKARAALATEAPVLARSIAGRVLGREVSS